MTSSKDTPPPKKPVLKEIEPVERICEEADDPHLALLTEWIHVLNERTEKFPLSHLGVLGAVKVLELHIVEGMQETDTEEYDE